MNVTAVESTTLATVGYEDARELLQLEFRGRAIYQYFGVPGGGARSLAARTLQGQLLQPGHSWTLPLFSGLKCPGRRTAGGAPAAAAATTAITLSNGKVLVRTPKLM